MPHTYEKLKAYADPPWPEYGGGKIKRGADRHYPLMSLKAIVQLGDALQEHIADDGCHLYLWVTNTHLANGFLVMDRWGFDYKTATTWVKDRFGLGQYYRGQTEHCLFGVRGRLPYRTTEDGKRSQGITAIHAPRTTHSAKPDEMRRMIEKVSHAPRLELFARRRFEEWDSWGNEIASDIVLANRLRAGDKPPRNELVKAGVVVKACRRNRFQVIEGGKSEQ